MCACTQQKAQENVDKHFDGRNIDSKKTKDFFLMSVYDRAEDKTAYKELDEIMEESKYDIIS